MDEDSLKAVITIQDDFQIVKQKMEEEILARVQNEKLYQLIHLYKLRGDQDMEDKIYAAKVKETIDKYKNLGQQIFQTQQDIISGRKKEFQFTKEEIKDLDRYFNPNNLNEQKAKNERFASSEVLPISNYWFMAFKNFDLLKPHIKDKDELILRNLHNIIVNTSDEFYVEVKFEFRENEYFQNQYLVKIFYLNQNYEPQRTDGSQIEWYEGKDVCRKTVKKSQKNRKTGAIRVITHEVEDESFFNFFNSINLEEIELMGQRKENSIINQNKYLDRMNLHYDIARSIIDELLPYSLEYYLDVRRVRSKQTEIQDLNFLKEINDNEIDSSESDDVEDDEKQIETNQPPQTEQGKKGKQDKGKDFGKQDRNTSAEKQNECNQY